MATQVLNINSYSNFLPIEFSTNRELVECKTQTIDLKIENFYNYSFAEVPEFVKEAKEGISIYSPMLCEEGTSGTYFLLNSKKKRVAVFKPMDEDGFSVNNPRGQNLQNTFPGFLAGESVTREIFAYEIDRGFAGVPETMMVSISHPIFGSDVKYGSLQKYVDDAIGNVEDFGTSLFSVDNIHRIALLDLILLNCDRNSQNILVNEEDYKLIPIDHALSLPDYKHLSTVQWFEWMNWRQTKQPISDQLKNEFIEHFKIDDLIAIAKKLGIRQECIHSLRLTHSFVCKSLSENKSLYDIGKEICSPVPEEPSSFSLFALEFIPDETSISKIDSESMMTQISLPITMAVMFVYVDSALYLCLLFYVNDQLVAMCCVDIPEKYVNNLKLKLKNKKIC